MSIEHIELLEAKWAELEQSGGFGEYYRVSIHSKLAQYCGLTATQQRLFVSVCTAVPKQLQDTKVVKISTNARADGQIAQIFELQDPRFSREFSILCSALISAVESCPSEFEAAAAQASAYNGWLKFFQPARNLSMEAARGLFAELWHLESEIIPLLGIEQALKSWVGPYGSNQDFVDLTFGAQEIKSKHLASNEVRIASEFQLDFAGRMELVVYSIEESESGMSIETLVVKLVEDMDPASSAEFLEKVSLVGYSADDPLCTGRTFSIQRLEKYDVQTPGFPRIIPSTLPRGVARVKYNLNLLAIDNSEKATLDNA